MWWISELPSDDDSCEWFFLTRLISDTNPGLPEVYSKESLRLYKIPEFCQNHAETIVYYSHAINSVLDDMIIELYPNVSYFLPNFLDDSALDWKKKSKGQLRPPSPSASSTSATTSEVNCCLWILREAITSISESEDEDGPVHEFVRVKLQVMSKELDSLRHDLEDCLYKFDNQQQLLTAVSREFKSGRRKHQG